MRPKSFTILAILTAIFVVAAIWSVGTQRGVTNIAADREHAFPDLIAKAKRQGADAADAVMP